MNAKVLDPECIKNPIVFLDVLVGGKQTGRLIIKLRKDVVPKTVENFRALCTGERGIGKLGKPLHYKGTQIHKVHLGFGITGGDLVNGDGSGGESIYGPVFDDENFGLTHNAEGVVSMVNFGIPNTNNSQFLITTASCTNLNGINVVVGRVLRGLSIVRDISALFAVNGVPEEEITIGNCGEIKDWHIGTTCDIKFGPIKSTTKTADFIYGKLPMPVSAENPIVFLDINIGHEYAGRMIIELRKDIVPKTAENFRALCTGECGIGQLGKPLHYKGKKFHKIKRVFVAQTGDIVNNDGTSGESIYGPIFEDENFELTHNDEGVVSMANYGKPDTNNSQFFITAVSCENLNGTNVVVGHVLRGLGVIGEMEQNTTDNGEPAENIFIADCGEIKSDEDWCISCDDETSDNLPLYPQDCSDNFATLTSEGMVALLTNIRHAGNHYFTQSHFYEARSKYRKANRYHNMLRKHYEWQQLDDPKCSDNNLKKLDVFSVLNNVNMAAVELKIGDYKNAKYACCEAIRIDPNCSKAFYRRGQAQISLKNYEEAINDLKRAHILMPENKQIVNEINRAKQLLIEYNRKQMNALKNLFN